MTGPDSDRWPANPEEDQSWNWLSTETCSEAETLFTQGAGDDQLAAAVGRYTVENLILNAVHEIGEWLRFDGRRVFPAHPPTQASQAVAREQGNGSVQLTVSFIHAPPPSPSPRTGQPVDDNNTRRLTAVADPSRFTYLPGTSVQYEADGPVIRLHANDQSAASWKSWWSPATLDALRSDADSETLIGSAQRDVHGAIVAWEANRICRSFYIDSRRPWRLSAPEPPGTERDADDEESDGIITLTIAYVGPEDTDPFLTV